MNLQDYFTTTTGTGILSTSDAAGNVNAALYSRPHFFEDGSIAFIMNDKLSHKNLQENTKAAYLFIESGSKRDGIRLYLEKIREEENAEMIAKLRRHGASDNDAPGKKLFLVYFKIIRTRPLVD